MRLAIAGAALVALVACSAGGGSFGQCSEPNIRIRHLDGRNAHNSVSDCLIEIDPRTPYTVAVLAQELWEWHYKRRTGNRITLHREIESHEREAQAAARLFPITAWQYRAQEAHQMLAGGYGFREAGWTQKSIFNAMKAHSEAAAEDVDGYMPDLLDLRERLKAVR